VLVIWLLMVITPLVVSARRGLSPGVVICFLLWIIGLIGILAARRRGRSWGGGLWRYASFRLTFVVILVVGQLLIFFGSSFSVAFFLMAAAAGLLVVWALTDNPDSFAGAVGRVLLVVGALAVCCFAGELVFRLDPMVVRFGGSVAARQRAVAVQYRQIWRANPYGLRSFHVNQGRPDGVRRIVVLGDSFSWGDQIAELESTWPYVMERALRERGLDVQVLNLAEPGFTTVNSAERLEILGWRFQPDLVILQYLLNDPLPSARRGRAEGESWLFPVWHLPPEIEAVRRHSYLYAFLNDRWVELQMRYRFREGYATLYDDEFIGWQDCQRALAGMARSCRRRDVPMLMAIFPALQGALDEGYQFRGLHLKVMGVALSLGLPAVDLTDALATVDSDARRWQAAPWDAHPNAEAHALFGRAMAEAVERTVGGVWQRDKVRH
jgi:lysophospholipase L1-like esterase